MTSPFITIILVGFWPSNGFASLIESSLSATTVENPSSRLPVAAAITAARTEGESLICADASVFCRTMSSPAPNSMLVRCVGRGNRRRSAESVGRRLSSTFVWCG